MQKLHKLKENARQKMNFETFFQFAYMHCIFLILVKLFHVLAVVAIHCYEMLNNITDMGSYF